jgi:hypothetical protein
MSNRLPFLATEIREAHAAVVASVRTTIERAVTVGKMLIEAKAAVKHGQWGPWLEGTGLTPRTAQRYMRLADLPPEKYDTVSHLGIRGALKEMTKSADLKAEINKMIDERLSRVEGFRLRNDAIEQWSKLDPKLYQGEDE